MKFNFEDFDELIEESLAKPKEPKLNQVFPCVDNNGKMRTETEEEGWG